MSDRKSPMSHKGTSSSGGNNGLIKISKPTKTTSKTKLANTNNNDNDESQSIRTSSSSHEISYQSSSKIDLKKEYIRFCKLYSSEPLDIVMGPLEKASEYGYESIIVDLRARALRGVDCIAISKILALDAPIIELNLSDCLLLPQGFQALIDGMCKNTRLQTLELRGNNIQSEMTKCLGKLLKTNCHLKRLLLEWNSLGNCKESFGIFCEGLSMNISLEYLDLRNNSLTAENAIQLANALQINKYLHEIDLSWNSIGIIGAKAIWESLRLNFNLQKILLCGNYIPDDILLSIEQCLKYQTERENMMDEYSKRTKLLTRQLQQNEQLHQNELQTIVTVFDAEEAELKDAIKESYDHINILDTKLQSEIVRNLSFVKQVEKLQNSLACINEKEETLRKALEIKEEHTEKLEQFFKTELETLKSNHNLRIKNYQEELETRTKYNELLSTKLIKLESELEIKSNELKTSQEQIEIIKNELLENKQHFNEQLKIEKEKWLNWKNEIKNSDKQEIVILKNEINTIETNLNDYIKQLEKSKFNAEEEIRQMKITFITLKTEAEEETIKIKNNLIMEHNKNLENITNQLNVLKNDYSRLESEKLKCLGEIRKYESENSTLVRQNENLRQQIVNMDKELLEKDGQIHTSLARARNEVKDQVEQLSKEEEANKTLRVQVLELQEQIAMLTLKQNREIQEKFSEMEHWKTQVERREVELNRLKEEDMRRAALLHEAFLAYMRSTSAATGIPLPSSFFQQSSNQLPTELVARITPIRPTTTGANANKVDTTTNLDDAGNAGAATSSGDHAPSGNSRRIS